MSDPSLPLPVRVEAMAVVWEEEEVGVFFWAAPSNEQLFHRTRQFMGWLPASLRAALNCPFLAKTQKLKHLLALEPCYSSPVPSSAPSPCSATCWSLAATTTGDPLNLVKLTFKNKLRIFPAPLSSLVWRKVQTVLSSATVHLYLHKEKKFIWKLKWLSASRCSCK